MRANTGTWCRGRIRLLRWGPFRGRAGGRHRSRRGWRAGRADNVGEPSGRYTGGPGPTKGIGALPVPTLFGGIELGLSPGMRQTVKTLFAVRWNCIVLRRRLPARCAPAGEGEAGSAQLFCNAASSKKFPSCSGIELCGFCSDPRPFIGGNPHAVNPQRRLVPRLRHCRERVFIDARPLPIFRPLD